MCLLILQVFHLENHGLMAFIQNACNFYWKNR
jgi:hypothetical protein